MKPPPPQPPDPHEQRVLDDIAECGWSGIIIEDDNEGPAFEYTVSFMETLNHPEVIIFGMSRNAMHDILWGIHHAICGGRRFDEPGRYEDILEGYPCEFRPVHELQHTEYLGYAMWHRRHVGKIGTLEAMQCVWPDRQGRFPEDAAAHPDFVKRQPDLTSFRPESLEND